MKRRDFLDLLKEKGNFKTKTEAEECLDNVIEAIKDVLKEEDKITFSGLGTFYTADVNRREGEVPKTKEKYVKEAHKSPRFRISKTLKKLVETNSLKK